MFLVVFKLPHLTSLKHRDNKGTGCRNMVIILIMA